MALFELEQHFGNPEGLDGDGSGSGTAARKIPTFKDCAAVEVDEVFFNEDEHAEMHNIDGKDYLVVFEEDDVRKHASHWEAGAKQNFDTGLYDGSAVLYVKVKDYGPKPKVGKRLTMDGNAKDKKRTYAVANCEEESGVYRIKLERIRQ